MGEPISPCGCGRALRNVIGIVVQAAVPVHADDDAEHLAARVLEAEHRCYPLALRLVAEGRVHIEGAGARVEGVSSAKEVLINPDPGQV